MGDIKPVDVYFCFRKAQAQSKNRGFRMPKDFDKHLKNKMSEKNRKALLETTAFFNTKWKNVNIERYMEYGFELLKSFSYMKFTDKRVMNLYKVKDKNLKRKLKLCKESMRDSLKFVKQYIKDNDITSIGRYCMLKNGHVSLIIEHYLNNYVDKFFVVWLMSKGLLKLNDDNISLVPYISEQYREILVSFDDIGEYLEKLGRLL